MKIMLTSFGIEQSLLDVGQRPSFFYRMPPVSFRSVTETFSPDFDLLLLCETLIMDESSFNTLTRNPNPRYIRVAETLSALRSGGHIDFADFHGILISKGDLLQRMVEQDLRILDQWVEPLKESLTLWNHFSEIAIRLNDRDQFASIVSRGAGMYYQRSFATQPLLAHELSHLMHASAVSTSSLSAKVEAALASSAKRKLKEYRLALRQAVTAYLGYVNANLILSNHLGVGFHDWLDFTPFYNMKFLAFGKNADAVQEQRKQVEKLFTVPFPELAIQDSKSLLKALEDKRITDLRNLIGDAVDGRIQFDEQFAKTILQEVLCVERKANQWRKVAGYATLPLGLIPWVGPLADKAASETAGHLIERKMQRNVGWFFMLSEIAEARRKERTVPSVETSG